MEGIRYFGTTDTVPTFPLTFPKGTSVDDSRRFSRCHQNMMRIVLTRSDRTALAPGIGLGLSFLTALGTLELVALSHIGNAEWWVPLRKKTGGAFVVAAKAFFARFENGVNGGAA